MENFLDLVKKRYSCRAYKPVGIGREDLEYILECVRFSPSAVNKQPWRFYIVTDDEHREALQQCYRREWFKTAPTYVIAVVDHEQEWERGDGKRHGDIDIAIAVEHLCLAAAERGLATCWVCNFDVALCRELFDLPDNEEPAVIIPIGFAADEPKEKHRKQLEDIIKT